MHIKNLEKDTMHALDFVNAQDQTRVRHYAINIFVHNTLFMGKMVSKICTLYVSAIAENDG